MSKRAITIEVTPLLGFALGALAVAAIAVGVAVGRKYPLAGTVGAASSEVAGGRSPNSSAGAMTIDEAKRRPAVAYADVQVDNGMEGDGKQIDEAKSPQ